MEARDIIEEQAGRQLVKVWGAQIPRYQGIAVNCYGSTLGALALNPSDFCSAGVDSGC